MQEEVLCCIKDEIKWIYVVKVSFLKDFPDFNPTKEILHIYNTSQHLKYVHNPHGPAIIPTSRQNYYVLEGKRYNLKEYEKKVNDIKFKSKFNELLNETT